MTIRPDQIPEASRRAAFQAFDFPRDGTWVELQAALDAAIAAGIAAWPGMYENEALPEYHELILPLETSE